MILKVQDQFRNRVNRDDAGRVDDPIALSIALPFRCSDFEFPFHSSHLHFFSGPRDTLSLVFSFSSIASHRRTGRSTASTAKRRPRAPRESSDRKTHEKARGGGGKRDHETARFRVIARSDVERTARMDHRCSVGDRWPLRAPIEKRRRDKTSGMKKERERERERRSLAPRYLVR